MPAPEAARPQSPVKPRRSRRWLCFAVLTIGLCIAWMYRVQLLRGLGNFLNVGVPLAERVDAVYVLGGGLETRPFVAAEIYRAGLADRILLPSPVLPATTEVISADAEVRLTSEVLERLGVPRDRIVTLNQPVQSTEGEAQALLDYLQKTPLQRVAIITSDFHTRRARLVFRKTLRPVTATMGVVSAPTDGFCGSDWWQYEKGVETYVLEWVKLLSYALRTSVGG